MKLRTLKGVAHDVAHHCASSLCFLHPHVGELAAQEGLDAVTIDLLAPQADRSLPKPLRLASSALRDWFTQLLSRYELEPGAVQSATVTFENFGSTPWIFGVVAEVVAASGRRYVSKQGVPR